MRPLATLSPVLAMALTGAPGTAVAQVTVLLPTEGDIKTTLDLEGDVQRGKDAYAECQTCHRTDASGRISFNIPRLSGQHASVLIKQLMSLPVVGKIGQGPPGLVPRGQALYASDCAGCHGERGNSNPAMPPILKNYATEDRQAIAAYLAQWPAPARTVAPDAPR